MDQEKFLRSEPSPSNEIAKEAVHIPIPIVFLTKLYDDSVYDILRQVIGYMIHHTNIKYYFTNQRQIQEVKKVFPEVECLLYSAGNMTLQKSIRYVVSLGGDGTVLYAGKLFQNRVTPDIIAIEKGTLGFLCRFKLQTLKDMVKSMVEDAENMTGRLQIERKMRIRCQNQQNEEKFVYHCLNQVAITKANPETALSIEIYLDNQYFTTTSGDGLLISTPTGSTAYSLSAGGPIVHNNIRTLLIQPISPNSLSFRSICVPSNIGITVKVCPLSKTPAFISYDGQVSQQIGICSTITVIQSNYDVLISSFAESNAMNNWTAKLKSLLKFNKQFKGEKLQNESKL